MGLVCFCSDNIHEFDVFVVTMSVSLMCVCGDTVSESDMCL